MRVRIAVSVTAIAVSAILGGQGLEGRQATRRAQPTAPASARPAPGTTAPATSGATAADRDARAARLALEAGDAAKALALADPVLAKEPAHPVAAAVKVQALLGLGERPRALDAYEAWFTVVHAENTTLLERIAVAELEALQAEPLLTPEALAALSLQNGPPGTRARTQLQELATANPPGSRSWPAIVALCRLGDADAAKRAAQAYKQSAGSGRVTALEAVIAAGGPGAEPILRDALRIPDAMLQSTAADGAATLKLKGLVPDLQQVAKTGEMFAKFTAAVALAHLGATGGESLIDAAATSPAQDARLRAAGARKARGDRGWIDAARPLLASEDVAVRYQAAAILLDVDRPAAVKVLQTGTQDPNPAVRTLVADVVTNDPATPVAELRRLLRDGVPRVRLLAAAAILRRPAPPQ